MKSIAILGSTGSVGVTTLDVVDRFRDRFRVVAMAAGRNLDLFVRQIERHRPELVSVATAELAGELKRRLGPSSKTEIKTRFITDARARSPRRLIRRPRSLSRRWSVRSDSVRLSQLSRPARTSRSLTRKCW